MAGSAINLGGMLSQMGNSMGNMGDSVGRGMFQPMLDKQAEERAAQRQIDEEKRKEAYLDRLKAEALLKKQGEMKDAQVITGEAQASLNTLDGRGYAEKGRQMQDAGILHGNDDMFDAGAKMIVDAEGIKTQGAMKGIYEIEKQLDNQDMGKEATALAAKTGMSQEDAMAQVQRRNEILTARKAELEEVPGVAAAQADLRLKQQTAELKRLEVAGARHAENARTEATNASRAAAAIMQGAEPKKAYENLTTVEREKAQQLVGDYSSKAQERRDLAVSVVDQRGSLKGAELTRYEQTLAAGQGFKTANKNLAKARDAQAAAELAGKVKLEQQRATADAASLMTQLLTTSSTDGWLKFDAREDMQEHFKDLSPDERKQAIIDAAVIYQTEFNSNEGDQQAAAEVAMTAIARQYGLDTTVNVAMTEQQKTFDADWKLNKDDVLELYKGDFPDGMTEKDEACVRSRWEEDSLKEASEAAHAESWGNNYGRIGQSVPR